MATSTQLRQQILAGEQDAALAALYGTDPAVLARQRQRYAAALEQFELYFGPGGRCISTPRRGGRSLAATTPTTSTATGWRRR